MTAASAAVGVACAGSGTQDAGAPLARFTVVESNEMLFVAEADSGHRVVVDWTVPSVLLPLDLYVLVHTRTFADVIDLAVDQLVEECMASRGFSFAFPDRTVRDLKSPHLRRYGPIDFEEVREYGYGPAPRDGAQQALLDFQSQPLDDEVEAALQGTPGEFPDPSAPDAPCMFVAGNSLTKGGDAFGEQLGPVQAAAAGSLSGAIADPTVVTALDEWRACLGKKGFSVQGTPFDLVASFVREAEEPPSSVEIETAIADLACKREVRLVEAWALAEGVLQLQAYETNSELFDQAREEQLLLILDPPFGEGLIGYASTRKAS